MLLNIWEAVMISPDTVNNIKSSVCAIGYFTEEPEGAFRRAQMDGGKVDHVRLPKRVIGSGVNVLLTSAGNIEARQQARDGRGQYHGEQHGHRQRGRW